MSGQVRSGQARSGQVRLGQVRSGQVRAGEVRSGLARSGQVRSGQARSGKAKQSQVRSGQERLGQPRTLQVGLDVSPSVSKEKLKKNKKCTVILVWFVCLRSETCLSSACLGQSSKKLRLVEIGPDFFWFLILVFVLFQCLWSGRL